MQRLVRVILGLLLLRSLRRLPCGCFLTWIARFAVWAGVVGAAVALIRRLLGRRADTVTEYDLSGWTPPFGDQGVPEKADAAATLGADEGDTYPWSATDTSEGPGMPEETLVAEDEAEAQDAEAPVEPVAKNDETATSDTKSGAIVEPMADDVEMSDAELEAFAERIAEEVADGLSTAAGEDAEADLANEALASGDTAPEPQAALTERTWVKGDGGHDCPEEFPVKAKASSQIYYVPGSNHYSVTIPDVCFKDEEAAVRGGYRAPKR